MNKTEYVVTILRYTYSLLIVMCVLLGITFKLLGHSDYNQVFHVALYFAFVWSLLEIFLCHKAFKKLDKDK